MARYPLHLAVPSRSCERCKWWHLHPRQNFEVPTKFGLISASMVLLFAAVHINLRSFSLSHYNLTNETD